MIDKIVEEIVDAVGEALGVDTGCCSDSKFEAACKAARSVLSRMLRNQ